MADEVVIAQKSPYILEVGPGKVYWCRCGRSKTQPFCDGSHTGTDFSPEEIEFLEKKQVAFCGCKHTKTPPLLRRYTFEALKKVRGEGLGAIGWNTGVRGER